MSNEDAERERRAVEYWRSLERLRPKEVVRPGPGQESVWDYPRPPRLERPKRTVRVAYDGEPIAESTEPFRVCETAGPPVYYVRRADVRLEHLQPSPSQSLCEWKGRATYWSLRTPSGVVPEIGWSYETPFERFAELAGAIAFYPGRVACWLDDERVRPQPGQFYGGWVTDEIVGPFKGEPGTEGW